MEDEQDIFNCNLPPIPSSLDSTEYASNQNFIHFKNSFILDNRQMNFSVSSPSYLRAVVTGNDICYIIIMN